MVASFFSWPVAGTHCIIFGLLGFTVTAKGKIKVMYKVMRSIAGKCRLFYNGLFKSSNDVTEN